MSNEITGEYHCNCEKGEFNLVIRCAGKNRHVAIFMIAAAVCAVLPDAIKPVLEKLDE